MIIIAYFLFSILVEFAIVFYFIVFCLFYLQRVFKQFIEFSSIILLRFFHFATNINLLVVFVNH